MPAAVSFERQFKKVHRNDGGCPDRFIERMFKEIIIKTLTTFFITKQIFKI